MNITHQYGEVMRDELQEGRCSVQKGGLKETERVISRKVSKILEEIRS